MSTDDASVQQFTSWQHHARRSRRRERIREITRQAHEGQTRNAGRLPYWVHTDAVADICHRAAERTGELDTDVADDLVIAAHGHDLYEDTSVAPESIRTEFGPRVDDWIAAMTNRIGDHDRADYMRQLVAADDEVRLIKCADLIDNTLSVAYGIHDLGLYWTRKFFEPIARETREMLLTTPFTRLPRTGEYLVGLVDAAWERLTDSLASTGTIMALRREEHAQAVAATAADETLTPEQRQFNISAMISPDSWEESLAKTRAREKAEGDRLFGDGPRFFIPDVDTDA
jgi:hypothetical protein